MGGRRGRWHNGGVARNRQGSNQYRTRTGVSLGASAVDLMAQSGPQRRCGEVWGTRCRALVHPPDFRHGNHGRSLETRIRAANEGADATVLVMLAQDPTDVVRTGLALNDHCPPEVLAQLAGDPDHHTRWAVAQHPHTPPETLAQLLRDRDLVVRQAALQHPNLPEEYRVLGSVVD